MKDFLLEAHQKDVQRVKETGGGVCSTCRWTSGCRHCDWRKTVRYWRRVETKNLYLEGYMESFVKAVKAKAKAKAEAKAKAKVKVKTMKAEKG